MLLLELIMVSLLTSLVYALFMAMSYKKEGESEAISAYECGFEPNSSARVPFSYRFFLIAILFIIFDVEVSLMLPIPYLSGVMIGGWIFFLFIFILLMGVLYEYYCGSLKWLS